VENDSYLIQTFHYQSRNELDKKPLNILTLSNEEIWKIIRFILEYELKRRYKTHEIIEVFEKKHALKGIATGTVKYYLKIYYTH